MFTQRRDTALALLTALHAHFNLYVFIAATLALLLLTGFTQWSPRSAVAQPAPGILVYGEPSQQAVTLEPWQQDTYTFTPLASYELTGRILSKKIYTSDRSAAISPVDLALGWQEMSNSEVLNRLDITQSGRWYYVSWRDSLVDSDTIISHSANTHILPATPEVAQVINAVQKNQVVRLRGSLVQVTATDGFLWRSSLSRWDTGNGSCEVFWVDSAEVVSLQTLQADAGTRASHQH
jgi:hypothetical protein